MTAWLSIREGCLDRCQTVRKSASLGYGKAQLQLGRMLLYGDEVPQNETEAARWL